MYGKDGTGSEVKWCLARHQSMDPPWLEFDLLYRRFISRIEGTLFDAARGTRPQNLDTSSVRFSEDGNVWIGYLVSAVFEKLGQFACSLVFTMT